MQRSGLIKDAAIEAIDKLEVFEAMIQDFETIVSSSENTACLMDKSSTIASIIKSASDKSCS